MAKSKAINGNKKVLAALTRLMKELDQKYSIRVGIIGEQAYEKHPHTDLTNAHLGAIHEFGATINVTPKMRAWLHYQGIHLKPETTTITIPARSFLRDTFFNGEAKERLADFAMLGSDEFNQEFYKLKLAQDPKFFEKVCKAIGAKALDLTHWPKHICIRRLLPPFLLPPRLRSRDFPLFRDALQVSSFQPRFLLTETALPMLRRFS